MIGEMGGYVDELLELAAAAALHNPAFLAILKTAQEWIDSYIRSNTTVKNLDDEQL